MKSKLLFTAAFALLAASGIAQAAELQYKPPPITNKEWLVCGGMLVLIMIGTINIRMAEMRERRQGTLPLVDPNLRSRK